jgi:hypothetical protein
MMPAAELAAYAYDALLVQIKAARKEFQSRFKVTRKQSDDFCHGWVYAAIAKIDQFSADNTISASEENALMLIQQKEQAAIDAWIKAKHPDLSKRAPAKRTFHRGAALYGAMQGKSAKILQPVTAAGSGGAPVLLGVNPQ